MADFDWCRQTLISLTQVRGYQLRPVAAMLILSNEISDFAVGTNHGRNSYPRRLGCISQKNNNHKKLIYNIRNEMIENIYRMNLFHI